MASDDEPIYCVCRLPYDETRFMIECDKCKDWFHGSCVGVQEHQAADIEIYHCPQCTSKHGPLVLKHRRNWHRHDYSEDGAKLKRSAVQTGTVVFIKELKSRSFSSADEIPIKRLHGSQLTPQYVEQEGFDVPILCEKKDGLNMTLPSPSISIQEIEQLVGPMREIDVIDVARQDDIKMTMREWVEYYSSPNREKILNVISLEFSNTALSEYVVPPKIVRQLSWARNVWPEQLPEEVTLPRPEVQKYCLMGVKDSFTDFHIDFGGTSVWYHVLRGEKVFYLIRPSQTNLTLYEKWLSSSNQSELFFGDQAEKCYQMVVKEGHTLFIPTGWIHAVLTPLDSLVFGGNFLHNFNIRLQLQCYEIERSVKTPEKYLFPSYEIINWYAAKHVLDSLQEYSEDGKSPPFYLLDGAKAMADCLKTWTQKKDLTSKSIFAKVGKQDAADYIQYGKLLKDLQKEVKKLSALEKTVSPKKQDTKRKRGEKSPQKTPQKMQVLDVLEQHTKQTLKMAQKERKENIYTFKDEDEMPTSLKVRIPKPGAYVAELDTNFTPSAGSGSSKKSTEVKDGKSETRVKEEKKVEVKLEEDKSETKKKSSGKKSKKELKKEKKEASRKLLLENVVKEEDLKVEKTPPIAPVKEVPPCLKFKLSNGKMVSTDKKMKRKKNQFLLLGADLSSTTALPTEDVKSDKFVSANVKSPQKSTRAEKPKKQDVSDTGPSKSKDKSGPVEKDSSKSETNKVKVKSKDSKQSKSAAQESKKSRKSRKESTKPSTPGDSDSDIDQLVVDENPKPVRAAKTMSTMKPASLKLKLPPESAKDNLEGGEPQSEGEVIRGGLNGSINDILTASGYATDQTFNDTSGMRDAIAGMLTMSRMGDPSSSPAPLPAPAGGSTRGKPAVDEEEELMADCYRDSEFVYPSFDLSDDEEDSIHRSKKKAEKDDNWNPKARIDQKLTRVEREHRVGVQKESVASTLASTAAKLAEAPPLDRKLPKKLIKVVKSPEAEVQPEPEPGPSSVLAEPVNAFRPGIKRPMDPCLAGTSSQPVKDKKPKKGMATVKQRLGKLLKIKKMVY